MLSSFPGSHVWAHKESGNEINMWCVWPSLGIRLWCVDVIIQDVKRVVCVVCVVGRDGP